MSQRVVFVALLAFALVIGAAGTALAETDVSYATADECYVCHQGAGAAISKVDFAVGAVDYQSCNVCHRYMPDLAHYHFGYPTTSKQIGEVACLDCHDDEAAFAFDLPANATSVVGPRPLTPYGYFATSTSLQTPASTLHAIHAKTGWVESTFGSWCSSCHASASCDVCHEGGAGHGDHAATAYPAVGIKQATGTAVTYAPSYCINESCHAVAAAGTTAFVPACTACHPAQVSVHGYEAIDHVADDAVIDGSACSACHTLDLASAHGDPQATGASCAVCHPTPRDSVGAWDQTCATGDCHSATSSAPMHAAADAAHVLSAANAVCLECHTGENLSSIHAGAADADTGATSCLVCHTGATGAPASADCTVCHFTFEDHYDTAVHATTPAAPGCPKCHSMDLKTEHARWSVGCMDCHGGGYDAVIDAWNTTCDACHPSRHSIRGARG